MSEVPAKMRHFRDFIAGNHIAGEGIEIGPGSSPIRLVPGQANVRYVDLAPIEELVAVHQVPDGWLAPDIVDDADTLSSIPDGSLDFLIACHVLEHTQDPIRVLRTWMSKLRPDGVLFMAVPDRRFCFDSVRPITTAAHLIDDFLLGPAQSEDAHLREWVTSIENLTDPDAIEVQIAHIKRTDLRPHYHVWEVREFVEFLLECRGRYLDFDLELAARNDTEIIVVMRRPV